jgi:hypothetical protein
MTRNKIRPGRRPASDLVAPRAPQPAIRNKIHSSNAKVTP